MELQNKLQEISDLIGSNKDTEAILKINALKEEYKNTPTPAVIQIAQDTIIKLSEENEQLKKENEVLRTKPIRQFQRHHRK